MKCFPCYVCLLILVSYGTQHFLDWVQETGKSSVCYEARSRGVKLDKCNQPSDGKSDE